jgi:hypothetical protein
MPFPNGAKKMKTTTAGHSAPWTLKEVLAIIDDTKKPVSYRAIRTWAGGQVCKVRPVIGKHRPKRYDWFGVLCFLLAKRLLQEVGLSGQMTQFFIDKLTSEFYDARLKQLKGEGRPTDTDFSQSLRGYFILVQQHGDRADDTILFFSDADKFGKAVMIFASTKNYAPRWTAINMPYLVEEMAGRISAWESRTEYKEPDRGAGIREAFRKIRQQNLAIVPTKD